MGFLKHLLFWPVTGPMYLTEFSLGKVQGVVKEELTDSSRVKEALLDLQLDLELGEIDDEEYERREAELMARLRDIRHWRREFGMPTRGGVVQVGDAAGPAGTASAPAPGAEAPAEGADDRADEAEEAGTVVGAGERATLDITLDWDEAEPTDSEDDAAAGDDDGDAAAEDDDR